MIKNFKNQSRYWSLEYAKHIPDIKLISKVAQNNKKSHLWLPVWSICTTADILFMEGNIPYHQFQLPFDLKKFWKIQPIKIYLIYLWDFRFRQIKIMDQSGIIFTFVHCVHNQSLRSIGWRLNFIYCHSIPVRIDLIRNV